ncbi:S41 family peptidase [Marinicella sp. S1101]|uniref:S41 family peptidase n=1 Tax=Marinicella marina TaxID=2996016 RepID=UPI002260FC02|nr:S41 family peptidase [Marinicella marina]MCX7553205.1 S41 family peptidase [Marinicella marina]MDJ1138937.1 S41 family peptidase [Marinicella marina]
MKILLLLIITTTTIAATEHPREQWLDVAAVVEDIKLAQGAYEHIHPGYTRYANKNSLDNAWQNIINVATKHNGMTLADLYLNISETLALVRCDHTKAELPKALRDARNSIPVYLPVLWHQVEGQVLVAAATETSGLKRGDVILKVDDKDIHELIEQVKKYIPVDGFTDHSKINLVAASAEHQGGALDHFGALLWQPKAQVKMTYRTVNGTVNEKVFSRITYDQWRALNPSRVRNFIDAVDFKWINTDTAVLKIDTFVNYRNPINPDKLYKPLFKALNETQTLILDLRENGGGSNEPPLRLLAYLMPEKFRQAKDVQVKTLNLNPFKKHLRTWEKSALNPKASRFIPNPNGSYSFKPNILDDTQWIKPNRNRFNGKLLVLTSNNNSSGSTNLLSVLKNRPNTTFIGEPTGGSVEGPTAGVIFFLKLPNSGITARIPAFRYYNDVSEFQLGKGITPDLEVSLSKDAFIAAQDPILDAALKF